MDKLYSVDRIIDDIVILEDLETEEVLEIHKNEINVQIKDGDILSLTDNIFVKNEKETEKRKKIILEKFKKLKEGN